MGHRDVRSLTGGIIAWCAVGQPMEGSSGWTGSGRGLLHRLAVSQSFQEHLGPGRGGSV
ncbi:hypothetical protein [Streptomyces halobius]|uniref:Rhodanese domain-containing protein n=1 Tax=Streptomyces halobius TaxID=2879846 RepID=A0ABY4M3P4_9ACTN|nr:hypothetical protein [Streptomyces halobius]UQA92027.1 hypothetical protein K9S39_09355 [Streptomyces halobius]